MWMLLPFVTMAVARADYLPSSSQVNANGSNHGVGENPGKWQRRGQEDYFEIQWIKDTLLDNLPSVTSTAEDVTSNAEDQAYPMTPPKDILSAEAAPASNTTSSPIGPMVPTPVPSSGPTKEETFGIVAYVGNDHDGYFYDRYPLGVCRGDCDTDDDCQEGLYCHYRGRMDPIPHCIGVPNISADYCTWDKASSYPPPNPPAISPIGAFRIKLYWEEGYRWQNETYDRYWCMISDFDGYPGNGECHYGLEVRPCVSNQVYIGKCLEDDPRQWFTMIDLGSRFTGIDDTQECLIATVDSAGLAERCLTRQDSALYLTDHCNPDDPKQRFFALSGSFTPGSNADGKSRFEISQYDGYTHDNCITNAHHPKSGEVVEFHVCEHVRNSDDETSYWQFLY